MFTRRNVWLFDDAWATDIVWYARAVQAMRAKPITDKTSWRFLAAIHGFDAALWRHQGYLAGGGAALPGGAGQVLESVQHGGWFFNPWHRGYLLAFEKIVREQVIALHGPATWALPYWQLLRHGGQDQPSTDATRLRLRPVAGRWGQSAPRAAALRPGSDGAPAGQAPRSGRRLGRAAVLWPRRRRATRASAAATSVDLRATVVAPVAWRCSRTTTSTVSSVDTAD